jgi:hypothetical protein
MDVPKYLNSGPSDKTKSLYSHKMNAQVTTPEKNDAPAVVNTTPTGQGNATTGFTTPQGQGITRPGVRDVPDGVRRGLFPATPREMPPFP